MLNIQNQNFLSKSEIRQRANSIFTTTSAPSTSEKYTHIPTEKVIDDMSTLGWGVVDAKQVKARVAGGMGFQKHLLVFRNNDIQITSEDGDTVYPQVLLTNSHDGKNAFTFTAGLFRMICENGLVVSTKEFESMKIRHMGYSFEELQKVIREMVEKLPLTVEALNKLRLIDLSQEAALDFAKKSLEIRFKDEIENIEIDLEELLKPTRVEDKGTDLWSTYNVIQEKLINGLFNYKYGIKVRKARKIKNFQQDIKLNTELYNLALEYANA
jgi:hypothetical protein